MLFAYSYMQKYEILATYSVQVKLYLVCHTKCVDHNIEVEALVQIELKLSESFSLYFIKGSVDDNILF